MKNGKGKIKKFTFFLIIIILFILAHTQISPATGGVELGLIFDKPFYEPSQRFSLSINVKNLSEDTLSRAKITVTIKTPDGEDEVFIRNLYTGKILPEKTKEFKIKKDIPRLSLSEGVYPVELVIKKGGEVLAEKQSFLTVLDEVKMPLAIALVWNLNESAHFNPEGVFLDHEIQSTCSKEGMCWQHLEALNTHPFVNVSMNITPIFLEQLQNISYGYKFLEGNEIKNIKKDSKEAERATEILEGYERAIKNRQIEIIPAPYSYPLLNELMNEEWGKDDASLQIALGKEITMETFHLSEEPRGMFSPELVLNMAAISCLSSEKVEYTLLRSSLPYFSTSSESEKVTESINIFKPYRVQSLEGDRLTALFADKEISNALTKTDDPQEAVQLLTGYLARIYLTDPYKQKIVAIAPFDLGWQPSSELLENVYCLLEEHWLNPVTLEIAFELVQAPTKPIGLVELRREKGYIQTKYDENIRSTHTKLSDFEKMVEDDNPLLDTLHKQILIAEATDWRLSKIPGIANKGLSFLTYVSETIDAELEKLMIGPEANLESGKAQVVIDNDTDYNFKVSISLDSQTTKNVTLYPKKNTISLSADNLKPGQKTKIYIGNGEKNIKESDVTLVEPSTTKTSFFLLVIIFALIVIISVVMVWVFKSKKGEGEKL